MTDNIINNSHEDYYNWLKDENFSIIKENMEIKNEFENYKCKLVSLELKIHEMEDEIEQLIQDKFTLSIENDIIKEKNSKLISNSEFLEKIVSLENKNKFLNYQLSKQNEQLGHLWDSKSESAIKIKELQKENDDLKLRIQELLESKQEISDHVSDKLCNIV